MFGGDTHVCDERLPRWKNGGVIVLVGTRSPDIYLTKLFRNVQVCYLVRRTYDCVINLAVHQGFPVNDYKRWSISV